jgi:hypothetical protein
MDLEHFEHFFENTFLIFYFNFYSYMRTHEFLVIMNRDQQLALLDEIYQRRSVVIGGKFSPTLTKGDKSKAWQVIWQWCAVRAYPFVRDDRDYTWLRDTVWSYFKREFKVRLSAGQHTESQNKIDTGKGEQLSDVHKMVSKIIGDDNPAVHGIAGTRSSWNEVDRQFSACLAHPQNCSRLRRPHRSALRLRLPHNTMRGRPVRRTRSTQLSAAVQ